jgi:hypothetical protein
LVCVSGTVSNGFCGFFSCVGGGCAGGGCCGAGGFWAHAMEAMAAQKQRRAIDRQARL